MALRTGTYSIHDLLAVTNQSVETFGEEQVAEVLRNDIAAHNRRFTDMASTLMFVTTERQLTYGRGSGGDMVKLDEFGRTPTQKGERSGGTIGLPLELNGYATGWTRKYLQRATPADLAAKVLYAQSADIRNMYGDLRKALFTPTNYTFNDFLVDEVDLEVKRLANADGMPIPDYDGTTFDAANHTHYLGSATWTNAAVDGTITTVREHGHTGQIVVMVNPSNVTNLVGISGTKYRAARSDRLIYGADQTVPVITIDRSARDDNRVVGLWDDLYDVWVKPWIPAGYVFVTDLQGPKVLAMRTGQPAGLQIVAEIDQHPLRAEYLEHEFGIGVFQRTNGAITYIGNSTYTAPSGL